MMQTYYHPDPLRKRITGFQYWVWDTNVNQGYWSTMPGSLNLGTSDAETSGFHLDYIKSTGWCLLCDDDLVMDIGL